MDNKEEELTIEDIVNLKSSCSKKVFDNFIIQKYSKEIKSDQNDEPKKKNKTKADLEFEKVFGCERNQNFKPTIDKRVLDVDNNDETVDEIEEADKPEEKTAKYRPPKFREIFKIEESKELRDPRFEKTSGYFNPKRFEKSYSFIKDARDNDKKILKKSLKKTNDEERKKEISKAIQRISNQEQSEKQRLEKQKLKNQLIEEKKQLLKNQNESKPIYVNKGEIKKKELIETFKNLKKSQKLTKYLERKRKKNTGRDKKSFLTSKSRDD